MLKSCWGRLEKRRVVTESTGDETGDKTAVSAGDDRLTNETAATGGVIYADEGPYMIDVRHVEEMVGTTREAAIGDRVRRGRDGDETGDETGGPGNETGGDGWDNVYGRRGVKI